MYSGIDAGYIATDGRVGHGVNTAAVDQEACASGYYSSAGATQASAGILATDGHRLAGSSSRGASREGFSRLTRTAR